MIHYLETGSNDPCYNLAFEEHVLERRREGDWLMLWQNAPSVILGLNQNAAEEVDVPWTEAHGVAVVRRATGRAGPCTTTWAISISPSSPTPARPPGSA